MKFNSLRLLATLFALAALSWSSTAEAQAGCRGKDIWATYPADQRQAVMARVSRTPFANGRLFKVQKGNAVSWIFGTQHVAATGRHALPRTVRTNLRKARVAYVEITDERARAYGAIIQGRSQMVVDMAGNNFHRHFSDADWKALLIRAKSRGFPAEALTVLKPWVLHYALSGSGCPNRRSGLVMDDRVERIARTARIPVHALDDPKTVVTLFDRFGDRNYATLLKAALREDTSDMSNATKTAEEMYLRGEIFLIHEFNVNEVRRVGGSSAANVYRRLFEDVLLKQRNRIWMRTLTPEIRQGGVFVAVGALHLGGPHGIVTELSRQGYQITQYQITR